MICIHIIIYMYICRMWYNYSLFICTGSLNFTIHAVWGGGGGGGGGDN